MVFPSTCCDILFCIVWMVKLNPEVHMIGAFFPPADAVPLCVLVCVSVFLFPCRSRKHRRRSACKPNCIQLSFIRIVRILGEVRKYTQVPREIQKWASLPVPVLLARGFHVLASHFHLLRCVICCTLRFFPLLFLLQDFFGHKKTQSKIAATGRFFPHPFNPRVTPAEKTRMASKITIINCS